MKKFYGALAYACGSIAIATLVLGIVVSGGQQAWADEGDEGGTPRDVEYVGYGCSRIGATSACNQGGCFAVYNTCHYTVNTQLRCCYPA